MSDSRVGKVIVVVLLLASCIAAKDAPELAKLQIEGGSVWGDGVWRPDNPNKNHKITQAVTHYQCSITGGTQLVGTEVWCREASANNPSGMLGIRVERLKVVEWDDKQIIAANDSSVCLSSEVIFDVKRKIATALDLGNKMPRVSSTPEKGFPTVRYYLQDTADYYTSNRSGSYRK